MVQNECVSGHEHIPSILDETFSKLRYFFTLKPTDWSVHVEVFIQEGKKKTEEKRRFKDRNLFRKRIWFNVSIT